MNEESLFYLALQQPGAAARAAFLDQACVNQPELRARLEKLLQAHDTPVSLFDKIAVDMDTDLDVVRSSGDSHLDQDSSSAFLSSTEKPGTRIGPYKLLQIIGQGGMGIVWLAEQEQPMRRQVALKILKAGMDSRQVIARFEQERQALALMDHVNIAKVLDAGTTENGRPFFVMELIHGIPLTQYCDDRQLTIRERLELFVPVCQAIQHAHQKGIIHRDIKPSNVLVMLCDGKPVPKVIDFGVAKAVDPKLTEETLFRELTEVGALIGTLEYMSPEQAELDNLDIDTRSDIYSLGVLLYELLTGMLPLDKKRIKEVGLLKALRLIREEDPPQPSTRLSSCETLPAVAAARKIEPVKLAKLLRGELDWIVMKCLETDRNRRYETANGLARDIQRYLTDEPLACQPSAGYRLRKLARRHKQALAAAAALVLGLMVLTCTIGYFLYERQIRRIEDENERQTRRIEQRHAIETALEKASGLLHKGQWAAARMVLEQARDRLGDQGAEDLRGRLKQAADDLDLVDRLESIRLRHAMLVIWGWFEPHAAEQEYAAALRKACLGEEGEDAKSVAARVRSSAVREYLVVALDEWASLTEDAKSQAWLLEVARHADPDDWRDRFHDPKVWRDRRALEALAGELLDDQRQLAKQKPQILLALAKEMYAAKADAAPLLAAAQTRYPDDFWLNLTLGLVLQATGHPSEATGFYRAALALRPESVAAQLGLGDALRTVGDLRDDKSLLDKAIREFRLVVDDDPEFAPAHRNLGLALKARGQLDEAICELRTAIELDPKYAVAHNHLGDALHDKKQWDEAITEYRTAIDLDPKFAVAYDNLAWLLATSPDPKVRDPRRAVELAKKAVELAPTDGNSWKTLGAVHYRAGDWNAAVLALKNSMDLWKGGDSLNWLFLAMAYWQLGDKDQARHWYGKAVQWMDKNQPKNDELRRFRSEAAELFGVEKKSK